MKEYMDEKKEESTEIVPVKKNNFPNTLGAPVYWTAERIEVEAEALVEWIAKEDNIYINRFALERKYHPSRFLEMAKKNQMFAQAHAFAKAFQEIKLVEGAAHSKLNPGFIKFALSNWHSWTEKSEISAKVENPLETLMRQIDGKSKELVNE